MKHRLIACCFILAFVPMAAPAAVPAAKIQAMLEKPQILCGRFDQSKQLAGMKKPLISHGRFCVANGKGVLWSTLHPFPNTLRLSGDAIVQMQGQRVAMRLDARQEPAVRTINTILFSLLAGDLAALDTLFDGEGAVDGKRWSAALKARDPALAKVIAGVAVEGNGFVRNLVIYEASGDRTSIAFSAMQTGAGAMTPDEAAQF